MYIITTRLNDKDFYMTGLISCNENMDQAIRYSGNSIDGELIHVRETFGCAIAVPSPELLVDELCTL